MKKICISCTDSEFERLNQFCKNYGLKKSFMFIKLFNFYRGLDEFANRVDILKSQDFIVRSKLKLDELSSDEIRELEYKLNWLLDDLTNANYFTDLVEKLAENIK